MRVLPRQGADEGDAAPLRRLPLVPQAGRPLQDAAGPRLPELPPAGLLDRRHLEPRRGDRLRALRGARRGRLREVPHGRRLPEEERRAASAATGRTTTGRRSRTTSRRASRPTCETCHKVSDTSWEQARFDHQATFPLAGQARDGGLRLVPQERRLPRDGARLRRVPPRRSTRRRRTRATSWRGSRRRARRATRPRTRRGQGSRSTTRSGPSWDATRRQACTTCHRSGVFQGLRSTCASCHQADYQKATNPNHVAAGFPTTCETCHKVSDASWQQGKFDHATAFPLVGKHTTQACASCHANGVYRGTAARLRRVPPPAVPEGDEPEPHPGGVPDDVRDVPQGDGPGVDRGGVQPREVAARGTSTRRRRARRATGAASSRGSRRRAPRATRPTTRRRRTRTTSPRGSRRRARRCHKVSDASWTQGTFNHSKWPLLGRHSGPRCATCHKNGVFQGTPERLRRRATCRSTRRRRTRTTRRRGSRRRARRATRRPTRRGARGRSTTRRCSRSSGRHATAACASCHKNGVYKGTPRRLRRVPPGEVPGDDEPEPRGGGVPDDVRDVPQGDGHVVGPGDVQPRGGVPAAGPARDGGVRLVPQERGLRGTPRTCVGCHLAKYQATTNPNHQAAGFPTTCETCHRATDTSWDQGTFNHTWFPITTGKHAGNPCSACHTNADELRRLHLRHVPRPGEDGPEHQGRARVRVRLERLLLVPPAGAG